MIDLWLCVGESCGDIRSWTGTLGLEKRNSSYHFRIQGKNGIVSVYTGENFSWKLVVMPSKDPHRLQDCKVGFMRREICKEQDVIDTFLIGMEVGENTFHLIVDVHDKLRHLQLDEHNKDYPIVISPTEHAPVQLAGLVDGVKYFTFFVGNKW